MTNTETETARLLLATFPLLVQFINSVAQRETDALTLPQLRAMEQLAIAPLTTTELARRRRVSLASMGELVQTLVERGFIVRQPNPSDRRQQILLLTDEGRQRQEEVFARLRDEFVALFSSRMEDQELGMLLHALPSLQRALAEELASRDG